MSKMFRVKMEVNYVAFVKAETPRMAQTQVAAMLTHTMQTTDSIKKIVYNGCKCDTLEYVSIMNSGTHHKLDYVNRINNAYNESRELFNQIVSLLAMRDKDAYEYLNPEVSPIEEIVYIYINQIADDTDLETILSYCRH